MKNLANCLNCKQDFDVEYAEIYLKGNKWFCSARCVLEFDKKWKEKMTREP